MYEEKTDFEIHPGQVLLLYPDRYHGGRCVYPDDLEFYWIHFTIISDQSKVNDYIKVPQVCTVQYPERIEYIFRNYLDQQSGINVYRPIMNSLMMQILLEVSRPSINDEDLPRSQIRLAQRAFNWIKINFSQDISAGDVAKELMCNADYLGRVFKSCWQHTMTECINRMRIAQAEKQLISTDLSIKQIAFGVGYADSGYFRRVFCKYKGVSPRKFRQMYARVHVNTQ